MHYIGAYETAEAAALAHDDFMWKYFGEQLFHWSLQPVSIHSKIYFNYRNPVEFYERLKGCSWKINGVTYVQSSGNCNTKIQHNGEKPPATYDTAEEAGRAFDNLALGDRVKTNYSA